MSELRISFPKKLKDEIELHPEIDWTLVFRKAAAKLLQRLQLIEFLDEKLDKSEFNGKDALELSELVKKKRLEQLRSEGII